MADLDWAHTCGVAQLAGSLGVGSLQCHVLGCGDKGLSSCCRLAWAFYMVAGKGSKSEIGREKGLLRPGLRSCTVSFLMHSVGQSKFKGWGNRLLSLDGRSHHVIFSGHTCGKR